jgi:hypothetical protein
MDRKLAKRESIEAEKENIGVRTTLNELETN